MTIESGDYKRAVDVGSSGVWHSILSTVSVLLEDRLNEVPHAYQFLQKTECKSADAFTTAREINLIRDMLSTFPPEQAVWDCNDLTKKAPWEGNLSPIVTSCSNLYTTADGEDLLYELTSILYYASTVNTDVHLT